MLSPSLRKRGLPLKKFGAEHDPELLTILVTDRVDSTKLQSDLGNVEAARLMELHRTIGCVDDNLQGVHAWKCAPQIRRPVCFSTNSTFDIHDRVHRGLIGVPRAN